MKARVRSERCRIAKANGTIRVLFASDLHLGLPWTRRCSTELVSLAESESPDLVLLGGDLVDNRSGLDAMEACVHRLTRRFEVAVVPGNHDVAAGLAEVRHRALRAGARWLLDEPFVCSRTPDVPVRVCGNPLGPIDAGAINVACLHDPAHVELACKAGFDVAFAGHLHGGQCVLFERRGRLYPGAWFNRWTGPRFRVGDLSMFVSAGLGDTIPLRLNCPREVIVCQIE